MPLAVTFELNEPSVRAIYWEPAGGEDVECRAPALKADLTLRIDAGEILSGAVPCHVRASGDTLSISTYTSGPSSIATTLAPNFSRPPLASPLPITALVHQGGLWSGNWEWFAHVDCGEAELCSGIEQVPLGTVTLGSEGG